MKIDRLIVRPDWLLPRERMGFLFLVGEGLWVLMCLRRRADSSFRRACGLPEGEALHARLSWRAASDKRRKK